MREEIDFEMCGRLKARRLRAAHPPKATTIEEHVRLERRERRRHVDRELRADRTYEEVEFERGLHGKIARN
jgi:hypothetical protein